MYNKIDAIRYWNYFNPIACTVEELIPVQCILIISNKSKNDSWEQSIYVSYFSALRPHRIWYCRVKYLWSISEIPVWNVCLWVNAYTDLKKLFDDEEYRLLVWDHVYSHGLLMFRRKAVLVFLWPQCILFLARLSLQTWWWRFYLFPKRQWTPIRLHGITSQETFLSDCHEVFSFHVFLIFVSVILLEWEFFFLLLCNIPREN